MNILQYESTDGNAEKRGLLFGIKFNIIGSCAEKTNVRSTRTDGGLENTPKGKHRRREDVFIRGSEGG